MGCDIHGVVQVRESWNGNRFRTDDEAGFERGRNYEVFSVLADVRNYYGLPSISEPRGLPEDLGLRDYLYAANGNDEIDLGPYQEHEFGDHSFSWLTLKELLEYDWSQKFTLSGYVDRKTYERCQAEGTTPNSWCGGVGGGGVVITTEDKVKDGTAPDGWNYVHMSWEGDLGQHTACFKAWLDWLALRYDWNLAKEPDSVRLVFGFDS